MGVDPTKFGKKMMSVFIRLHYFEYKNNRPIASHLQRMKLLTSFKIDKLLRPTQGLVCRLNKHTRRVPFFKFR